MSQVKCSHVIGTVILVIFYAQSIWQAFRYGQLMSVNGCKGVVPSGGGGWVPPARLILNDSLSNNNSQRTMGNTHHWCDEARQICLDKGHEFESVLNGHPSVYNKVETLEAVANDEAARQAIQVQGDPRDFGGKNLPHTLNTWEPVYHCPFEERVGPYGDGGKWMCRVRDYSGDSCVVYSFGCSGDIRWERDLARLTGCKIHIYDPTPWVVNTMTNARRETQQETSKISPVGRSEFLIPYGTEYHPWGLFESSSDLAKAVLRRLNPYAEGGTLGEIVAKTGGEVPQIVKVDIEGSEWFLNFTADAETWKQVHMFMVEIHLKDVGAGFYKGSLSEWQYLQNWIRQIEDLGFRIYHKEINVYQGDGSCWELAFVNIRFF